MIGELFLPRRHGDTERGEADGWQSIALGGVARDSVAGYGWIRGEDTEKEPRSAMRGKLARTTKTQRHEGENGNREMAAPRVVAAIVPSGPCSETWSP